MPAFTRRQYAGAAAATTITAGINTTDTTCTLAATTGWPSTAGVPFYVVIDPGTSAEEKCSATISGSTLTLTRAQDDTTASSHSSGATIYPVFTANDADEANELVAKLTTKGDLLVTTGSALNRLAVGSNGQVLVADSGQTNGVAWVDPQTNRNVVINGAMQVAQRGTSVAGFTGGDFIYRTADRFNTAISSLGTWTESVENDAPTGSGFRKSLKFLCTTADASPAAADYFIFNQNLEGQNIQQFLKGTTSAKPFALSFWVKSNVTGTYTVNLRDADNARSCAASYSVSASATWEKKTIIFPADTTGAFDNDNALSLRLTFNLALGSLYTSGTLGTTWASTVDANLGVGQTNLASAINNYWQITGVQLEAGAVATPFEFEDAGVTLAKCQRYYYFVCSGTTKTFGVGFYNSATQVDTVVGFPVTMRTEPTLAATSGTDYYRFTSNSSTDTFNSLTIARQTTNTALLTNNTEASGTEYRAGRFETNNASSFVAFTAEL